MLPTTKITYNCQDDEVKNLIFDYKKNINKFRSTIKKYIEDDDVLKHYLSNLSIYECKFGLSTFVSHLRVDIIRETNRNLLRKGRRAHRKIDYLKECERIFSSNLLSDVEDSEIRIVTLATRSSIPQESLRILEGITLITRENIEDLSFYNHMKT